MIAAKVEAAATRSAELRLRRYNQEGRGRVTTPGVRRRE